jgi:phage shock protein PspC (stress-responsive transcriptional regulator)
MRVIFAGLTFFGGAGIPLYLLLWAFVPRDPESLFLVPGRSPGFLSILFKAFIVMVVVGVITGHFGMGAGAATFTLGLLVGLFFYWRSRRDSGEDGGTDLTRARYFRSDSNRKIMGVFGGLSETLGVDATLLRVAGVVLLVAGFPVTICIYILMGVLMPSREQFLLRID